MSPTLKRGIRVGLLVGLLAVSLAGYASFDNGQEFLGTGVIVLLIVLMVMVTFVS